MFFLRKEDVSDFQDRCEVALFLSHHGNIEFVEYKSKFHFIGSTEEYGEEDFYLFNSPSNAEKTGVVYRFQSGKELMGFRYDRFNPEFIDDYREFAENPFKYIIGHFFENGWIQRFGRLFLSIPPESFEEVNLYKYKGAPNEKDEDSVKLFNKFISGKLTFVNPSTCNDPFDCECEIPLYESIPLVVYIAINKTKFSKSPARRISLKDITALVEKYIESKAVEFDYSLNMFEDLIEYIYWEKYSMLGSDSIIALYCYDMIQNVINLKNKFRILCLSHEPKDILMWGYYGESGKGICCGHKPKSIVNGLDIIRGNYICIYGNVIYPSTNKRPKFQRSSKNDIADDIWNYVVQCTFTKYYNWKHENEFRFLLVGPEFSSDYVEIDSNIEEIYLGCKSDKVSLYKRTSFSPTPYILKMHPDNYELYV